MLFGRLRVPLDREVLPRDGSEESGVHVVAPPRGETPRRQLFIVEPLGQPAAAAELPLHRASPEQRDDYAGLERLDRDELDED